MRNAVNRLTLVILLAGVLALQEEDRAAMAQTSALPSSWSVEVYGNKTQFIIPRSINNKGIAAAQFCKPLEVVDASTVGVSLAMMIQSSS
jgi:hypothetical protein